jgi:hypothetical protein
MFPNLFPRSSDHRAKLSSARWAYSSKVSYLYNSIYVFDTLARKYKLPVQNHFSVLMFVFQIFGTCRITAQYINNKTFCLLRVSLKQCQHDATLWTHPRSNIAEHHRGSDLAWVHIYRYITQIYRWTCFFVLDPPSIFVDFRNTVDLQCSCSYDHYECHFISISA